MSRSFKQKAALGSTLGHINPDISGFPTPSPEDVKAAAEVLWGRQMDTATADAIGGTEKCAQAMRQFLEGYPVTAAMTFAMTFGYMLRVQIEKQAAVRLVQ